MAAGWQTWVHHPQTPVTPPSTEVPHATLKGRRLAHQLTLHSGIAGISRWILRGESLAGIQEADHTLTGWTDLVALAIEWLGHCPALVARSVIPVSLSRPGAPCDDGVHAIPEAHAPARFPPLAQLSSARLFLREWALFDWAPLPREVPIQLQSSVRQIPQALPQFPLSLPIGFARERPGLVSHG